MAKLLVVGTPIGNLDDMTIRAIRVLSETDIIACEDTRVTRKLLSHFEIFNKRLISYHNLNEKNSALGIINLINEQHNVAIVSDAGMPVINDPGFEVIKQALLHDIKIEIIPGVSAVTTTVALSNFGSHYTFLGFLKAKTIQRQNQLKKLNEGVYIAFLSPHRLESELNDIEIIFGSDILVFIARELTKKFETHYRGTITQVRKNIVNKIKGEFTIAFIVKKCKKVKKYS